ncbi:MAG: nucleotidyltransferase family protein [Fulvivirga sp.]|uniref:nucleotidyltransferase family protein n=2 Tax=Fulvivirga sp. TaxID=1931237 RepID=UPI0032F06421
MAKYKIAKLGVFGSYARNNESTDSDLDILVQFDQKISLFEIIELELQLSEALGIKVDLVTDKSLSKHIRPFVESELVTI